MGVIVKFSHLVLFLNLIFCTFCLTILTKSNTANAEQLNFSKNDLGDKIQFSYRWVNHLNIEKHLNFTLPKKAVFNRFRKFKSYKNEFNEAYIHKKIQACIQETPLKGVQINFAKQNGHTKIDIKGKKQQDVNNAYQELAKLERKYNDEYLQSNNYQRFVTYNGIKTIKPNHVFIAEKSVDDLKIFKELVLDDVSVKNIRKATNFVLGFVQSIPYEKLESRITSSGAGFTPPLNLLYRNQGDCDSKVTLTASILRALMPRINLTIVYIDNHALLGIDLLPEGDDITIVKDSITYVLAEPTGPAILALGKIALFSKQAVLAGLYNVEKFK